MGQIVCTADFIGQMSDPRYVEKLPGLFQEFAESYEFQGISENARDFRDYEDLLVKTPDFWNKFVKNRLTIDCDNQWRFLEDPENGERTHTSHKSTPTSESSKNY